MNRWWQLFVLVLTAVLALGSDVVGYSQESPVSPQDSFKWLQVGADYHVELVACEPQITDPVSMQIDEFGTLWVVEMRDYPVADETPKSRVVRLQDKDGDGFFETAQVFADQLRFATGVQPWQNGALVTVQGQLLMLRDSDGDGTADTREVWLDGFSTGNPQLRANHPMIGPDGWLYIASGLRGGKVTSHLPFGQPNQEPVDITGSDLRVNLWSGELEAIAGPSQFGLSFDRIGNRYAVSNRQPCLEIVSDRNNISRSPLAGLVGPTSEVSPGEAASKVFPLIHAWTTSNLHAGQFTAACGMLVTHSPHLPKGFFGHVLTCEPTGGLIQMRSIERIDGRSKVSGDHAGPEWLASRDPWFRPVDIYEGPDGAIYVVDMYRAVIEHPEWVPTELKKRPDERFGDAHGRIYRVTKGNSSTKLGPFVTGFSERTPFDVQQTLHWLNHEHAWNRNIATKRIVQETQIANKEAWIDKIRLQSIAPTNESPVTASMLLLLAGLGGLDEPTIAIMLRSQDAHKRLIGWKSMQRQVSDWHRHWSKNAIEAFRSKQTQSDEFREIAWLLAAHADNSTSMTLDESLLSSLVTALLQRSNDPHNWMAISATVRNQLPVFLQELIYQTGAMSESNLDLSGMTAISKLASNASKQMRLDELRGIVDVCVNALKHNATIDSRRCVYAVLDGISKSKLMTGDDRDTIEPIVYQGISTSDANIQRFAISILGSLSSEAAMKQAFTLLQHPDAKMVKLAIGACSLHDSPEFLEWLLKSFPTSLPDLRQDIFAALRNHPRRLRGLIDRLESGMMPMKVFDAAQIQSLKAVKDESLSPRLTKLLAASINNNRQRVIDDYKHRLEAIRVNPAVNRGKAIFEKNCASCHRLNSAGTQVGPDISDSRTQTFDTLLISILDPNRTIDANFFRFLASTEDGRIVEGVLKDANAQTVTLQNQNGTTVLLRTEIEELRSSGTSLMPEGIEVQIPVQDMADLLWYIKNWRYAVDHIPANASLQR